MNTNTIFLAIVVAAVLAVAIAPELVETASAKKIQVCPSGNECQGQSGEHNPNAECAAGSKLQTNANCP
jgi:hypothetical protein